LNVFQNTHKKSYQYKKIITFFTWNFRNSDSICLVRKIGKSSVTTHTKKIILKKNWHYKIQNHVLHFVHHFLNTTPEVLGILVNFYGIYNVIIAFR
jgi:hypothetical protein